MPDNIMKYRRFDYCNRCNEDRVIECYDVYDNPLNYSLLLDRMNKGFKIDEIFNRNRTYSYFKCKKCGTIYRLDWQNFKFPIPLKMEFFVDYLISKK